jgi:5-deoxy-glucuronate isomerase
MSRLASRHTLPEGPGIHPLDAGLDELGFALVRAEDAPVRVELGGREGVLVKLAGPEGEVRVDGEAFVLPARDSVFNDAPSAVYAPPGSTLEAAGPLLAGLFLAAAETAGAEPVSAPPADAPAPYAVRPEDVVTVARGRGNFARAVRDIVPATRPGLRLLVGETLNPPGNWSSSPPHKHDRDAAPEEAQLEEVYLFRVDPAQGFGLQLSYDGADERAFRVRDLDVAAIPAGYHPVVAAPGYRLYYLWGLAGSGRQLRWFPDPDHAWVDPA